MPLVLFGLALAFSVMLALGGSEIDRSLRVLLRGEGWSEAAGWIAMLTPPVALLGIGLVAAGAMVLLERRRPAVLSVVILLPGYGLTLWLGQATRPLREGLDARAGVAAAFPSASASMATLAFLSAALLLPVGRRAPTLSLPAATAGAILVGLAQLPVGRTWPSDVIGGWILGLFWTLTVLVIARHPAVLPAAPPPRFRGPWEHDER